MAPVPPVDGLLPDPGELHAHLITQFEFLKGRNSTLSRHSDEFEQIYSDLKTSDPSNWSLDITPNWAIRLELPDFIVETKPSRDFAIENGWAIVGGNIDVSDGTYTDYAFHLSFLASEEEEVRGEPSSGPCCWRAEEQDWDYRVAKQYHFDIDPGRNRNEAKPVAHFQSQGSFEQARLPPGLRHQDIHYCSTPLDKPRLAHPPMDPILLLQIVSEQYGGPESMFSEHWDPMVVEAESTLWTGYYSGVSEHLGEDDRSAPCNILISNDRID